MDPLQEFLRTQKLINPRLKVSKSAAAVVAKPSVPAKTEVAIFGPKNISAPTKAAAADSHSPAKIGSGDKKASVGNGANEKKASANNGSNYKKASANKEDESKVSAKAERREPRMRANLVPPPPPRDSCGSYSSVRQRHVLAAVCTA